MISKWCCAGPLRNPQGCPSLTPKPFTRLPLSAAVSCDSPGDPEPLPQRSIQARLLTQLSSQGAMGFHSHTFGDRKNRLGTGGREPYHDGSASSTVRVATMHCCLGLRIPKALGRLGKVSSALRRGPGKPSQGKSERSTGLLSFLLADNSPIPFTLHLASPPPRPSPRPVHLSVETPYHCLPAHPYSTPASARTAWVLALLPLALGWDGLLALCTAHLLPLRNRGM